MASSLGLASCGPRRLSVAKVVGHRKLAAAVVGEDLEEGAAGRLRSEAEVEGGLLEEVAVGTNPEVEGEEATQLLHRSTP